ncbi:Target of rapamycin complex subunit lst8 [Eumeta japonica]|uniref:Target of rapamycin complex subunit lst8 n=1 Tax=Eumeta variegata TaxID=151549 RepID=A0A4C1V5H3_EUMVA|nr:Target of rapamycin complex subunit lst8 [Eumeta japonica]
MAGDGNTSGVTGSPGSGQVALVTGGYDHTIKLWQAHSGVCLRTMQHPDSQVNALEMMPDSQLVAACGYQHIRMYDLGSANPDPVINYDNISKNISRVGFQRQELPKLERQKHRAQKYQSDWEALDIFKKWLKPGPNEYKAKCIVCEITTTSKQISAMASFVTKKDPPHVQNAEVKLTGFLVEHNLAFKTVDHLTELLKSIFPDSKIAQQITLKRTKATAIATAVIGETEKEVLAFKLKRSKFSAISDESTDISTQKSSCIVLRFYDENSKQIVSKFWELSKIFDSSNPDLANEGATGKNLFNALIKSFQDANIPLTNLIGFAADGCSVMMGENNSVSSRLKEHCPGIIIIKCVCHSAHLCASAACKELPRRCEDLAREIYSFFKSSSKRQCQFAEFQEFLNLKPHKMLHPSQTRWLSLVAVVERIPEQWDALKLFFTKTWLSEKLISTEIIFNTK